MLDYAISQMKSIENIRFIGTASHKSAVISFLLEPHHPTDVGTLIDFMGVAVRNGSSLYTATDGPPGDSGNHKSFHLLPITQGRNRLFLHGFTHRQQDARLNMKIICFYNNFPHQKQVFPLENKPLFYLKPDTSILTHNRPFFIPEFTDNLHCQVELVIRIDKLGKYIQTNYVSTYFHEIALGINIFDKSLQTQCI